MIVLRSALFALCMVVVTPIYAVIATLTFPFPPMVRYRVISGWAKMMIALLRLLCRLDYRVLGAENLPAGAAIIASKHQSAWETLAFQRIFPPQVWVLKRELLRIPFFGWGLAMLSPIAINRRDGRGALKEIAAQGVDRLQRGFWVVIFPEGTRMVPGTRGKYGIGAAHLATHAGVPVVPVAHNAGEFWGKNGFLKRPGTITVSIGPPIDPSGVSASELTRRIEAWIEAEVIRLPHAKAAGAPQPQVP
ncbi:MAG: lysophospholipid acyltransferase family protein [Betaproteobacteria bacterium]|nr:lysophospholipid acyltransferase family protein [Betaproteobacteria bacterium]